METKPFYASKTINFNAIASLISVILLSAGVPVPVEAILGVFTVGNIILRYITKKPIKILPTKKTKLP